MKERETIISPADLEEIAKVQQSNDALNKTLAQGHPTADMVLKMDQWISPESIEPGALRQREFDPLSGDDTYLIHINPAIDSAALADLKRLPPGSIIEAVSKEGPDDIRYMDTNDYTTFVAGDGKDNPGFIGRKTIAMVIASNNRGVALDGRVRRPRTQDAAEQGTWMGLQIDNQGKQIAEESVAYSLLAERYRSGSRTEAPTVVSGVVDAISSFANGTDKNIDDTSLSSVACLSHEAPLPSAQKDWRGRNFAPRTLGITNSGVTVNGTQSHNDWVIRARIVDGHIAPITHVNEFVPNSNLLLWNGLRSTAETLTNPRGAGAGTPVEEVTEKLVGFLTKTLPDRVSGNASLGGVVADFKQRFRSGPIKQK